MILTKVESSNLDAVGFANGTLRVKFKNGTRYELAATQEEYDALLPSVGAHYNRVFRSRPATKLEDED